LTRAAAGDVYMLLAGIPIELQRLKAAWAAIPPEPV